MKALLKGIIAIALFVIGIGGLILIAAQINPPTISSEYWETPDFVRDIENSGIFEELWMRSDVYIAYTRNGLRFTSSDGKAFVLGSLNIDEPIKIKALDVWTGNLVWETSPMPLFTSYATQGALFVGLGGAGSIKNYDPATGEIQWQRHFRPSSGVEHLTVFDDELHAYMSPDKHRVLRATDGKTIFSLFDEQPPYFDAHICGNEDQTPVYTEDTVYFRSSGQSGKICAVDLATGEVSWRSAITIVSNIVATTDRIFVLVESGELVVLSPQTGEIIPDLRIAFDNAPFTLYTPRTEVGNYFVAYDKTTEILLTYLGDSRQLFAFRASDQ